MKVIAPEEGQIDTNDVPVGSNGEWRRDALSERVLQVTGEMVPLWEKLTRQEFGGPVQTIVFCPSIVDAIDAAEKFQQAGHSFAVVHSKQGDQENQDLIDAYVRGEYLGIVNCAVSDQGLRRTGDPVSDRCVPRAQVAQDAVAAVGPADPDRAGQEVRPADRHGRQLGCVHAGRLCVLRSRRVSELAAGKEKKAKRQTPEQIKAMKCHVCGFYWPRREPGQPGLTECPSCGAARKRGRGRLQYVSGNMVHVDTVDGTGRKLPWDGDWWEELCAIASGITMDDDHAQRIALAKYKSLFGRWPKGRPFERVSRAPHPKVARYELNRYRRYQRQQRS